MFYLLLIIIAVLVIYIVMIYNTLQSKMQNIRESFSNIQANLKKRLDLSNQIIDIAKDYGTKEQITQLAVSNNNSVNVAALAQAFPELKANQTYQKLMEQLENLEQSLLQKREKYNEEVKKYNSYKNSFPQILIASKLSFDTVAYFNINDEDFSENLKIFQKDDSAKIQEILADSNKKISDLTANITTNAKNAINKTISNKKDE